MNDVVYKNPEELKFNLIKELPQVLKNIKKTMNPDLDTHYVYTHVIKLLTDLPNFEYSSSASYSLDVMPDSSLHITLTPNSKLSVYLQLVNNSKEPENIIFSVFYEDNCLAIERGDSDTALQRIALLTNDLTN